MAFLQAHGKAKTPADIARLEGIEVTRVREILRLTILAPGNQYTLRRKKGTEAMDVTQYLPPDEVYAGVGL